MSNIAIASLKAGEIIVNSPTEGMPIAVYSIDGTKVAQYTTIIGAIIIKVNNAGVYIIKVPGKRVKISVH